MVALFEKSPVIPGPDIKNPKTSFIGSVDSQGVYSGYSSDAKTYLNSTKELVGTKSNSNTAAFWISSLTSKAKSGHLLLEKPKR